MNKREKEFLELHEAMHRLHEQLVQQAEAKAAYNVAMDYLLNEVLKNYGVKPQ